MTESNLVNAIKGWNIRRIMNAIHSIYYFSSRRPALKGMLAAFSLVLINSSLAAAQQETYMDFSHPNVTVDLSVIDNGGYQQPLGAAATVFGGAAGFKLIMPGSRAPRSMLHVPTVSGETLAPPKKQKAVQAAAKAPAPVVDTPDPVVQEAPPPAPKPAEIAAAPKKLEAQAKPAPVAKKAPPAAPVVKPAPKVAKVEPPKAPEPAPAPKAETPAAPEQAALPAASATMEIGQALQVVFGDDQTKLPASAKTELLALAEKMKGQDKIRLQLMAFAGGPSLSSSLARRMSLSRALSIRSFLIESGVRSTRIDVRALGNKTTEEPVNRVDLNITER